jgi:hypothetical protein
VQVHANSSCLADLCDVFLCDLEDESSEYAAHFLEMPCLPHEMEAREQRCVSLMYDCVAPDPAPEAAGADAGAGGDDVGDFLPSSGTPRAAAVRSYFTQSVCGRLRCDVLYQQSRLATFLRLHGATLYWLLALVGLAALGWLHVGIFGVSWLRFNPRRDTSFGLRTKTPLIRQAIAQLRPKSKKL